MRLTKQKNLAAAANGAKVIDATAGSLNTAHLIDGTEATNWGAVTETNVDESQPFVSVDLAKGTHTIRRVQVSALLTPAPAAADDDPARGRRGPGLRLALHRPAPVRHRGLHHGLRLGQGDVEAGLHLQGRRLPGRAPPPGRARPDAALLRDQAGHAPPRCVW